MREVFNVMIGMFIFAILLFVFFTFTNLINLLLSDTLREEQIEQQIHQTCLMKYTDRTDIYNCIDIERMKVRYNYNESR